jgi:hypothetical protein
MFRTLRAFAWMRWRVLVNSLERMGGRDRLERLSVAFEQILPLIAYALLAPSAIGLAGLGGYAGYWLAGGTPVVTFEALRILLLATCALAVVGPLLMPSMEPTAIVRLLLLPIPRRTLYAAQAAGGLGEPWVLIALPVVLSIPVGLAAAGAWMAAPIALVAGVLLVLCLIGLSALSTLLIHLVVRDRRRGELLALLFIVVLPAVSLLPALLMTGRDGPAGTERQTTTTPAPTWITRTSEVAFAIVPSEMFARATRSAARHDSGGQLLPLLGLLTSGTLLHALAMLTFGRLLDSPSAGTRRAPSSLAPPGRIRLPFLSRPSAAVAQAQLRLALRTPRGRSMMLAPLVGCGLVGIVAFRRGEMTLGFIDLANGLSLATLGGVASLLSLLPFAMNQFAIDRSGLTLALLSPLATRELLAGKAVGLGLIAGAPALLVMLVAFVLFPGGAPELWLSLPPAFVAAYLLAAPGAATLSAVFPRTVDLNSAGSGSNAHGLANLLGMLVFAAASLPSILIVLVTTQLVQMATLTPIVMLAWCGLAFLVSRLLFGAVAVLFDKRRENLGIVAV